MKKLIFLSSVLIMVSSLAISQNLEWEDNPEFIVWSVDGKATFSNQDFNNEPIKQGMNITPESSITLKDGASVELVYEGVRVPIFAKKGTYQLAEYVVSESDRLMEEFWATVRKAYHGEGGLEGEALAMWDKGHGGGGAGLGSGGKKGHGGGGAGLGSGGKKGHGGGGAGLGSGGKKGHGGGGAGLGSGGKKGHGGGGAGLGSGGKKGHGGGGAGLGSGGKKGHGGGGAGLGSGGKKGHGGIMNFSITPITPIGPGVPSKTITFTWDNKKNDNANYHFTISSENTGTLLFASTTDQTSIKVDLSKYGDFSKEVLVWQVHALGKENHKSGQIRFSLIQPNFEDTTLKALKNNSAYSKADDVQKMLYEAVTFERKGLTFLAEDRYKKILETNPDNKMAKRLYENFLSFR